MDLCLSCLGVCVCCVSTLFVRININIKQEMNVEAFTELNLKAYIIHQVGKINQQRTALLSSRMKNYHLKLSL